MLNQINLKDLEGWPIFKVFHAEHDSKIVLVNDNGFCVIGIDRAYERCDDRIYSEPFDLEDCVYPNEYIENEIFTEKEYHEARLDKLNRVNQYNKATRAKMYEQLRKEFEDATP